MRGEEGEGEGVVGLDEGEVRGYRQVSSVCTYGKRYIYFLEISETIQGSF